MHTPNLDNACPLSILLREVDTETLGLKGGLVCLWAKGQIIQ